MVQISNILIQNLNFLFNISIIQYINLKEQVQNVVSIVHRKYLKRSCMYPHRTPVNLEGDDSGHF